MKRIYKTWIWAALLMGGLAGCYNDKGNYDYRDINEVSFTITAQDQQGRTMPMDENGVCRYKQPASEEPMVVTYTPEIVQTQLKGEENLEFLWKVSSFQDGKNKVEEFTDKVLQLTFPPKKGTSYTVVFSVTDKSNNVSAYRQLSIKTVQPYTYSWFVLNGDEKSRQISAVEEPDSETPVITADAYYDLIGEKKFEEAVDLVYAPIGDESNSGNSPEVLIVVEKDHLYRLNPFTMKVEATEKELMSYHTEMAYGVDANVQSIYPVLVGANRRLYLFDGKSFFEPREPKDKELNNYTVDLIGETGESQHICFWSEELKQFLCTNLREPNKAEVEILGKGKDWTGQEVLWVGMTNKDNDKSAIAMALVKDTKTGDITAWHFSTDKDNEATGEHVGQLPIDKNSLFITAPMRFADQFFYTVGSKLYRYVMASGESMEIYDAGGEIVQLKFRVNQEHGMTDRGDIDYRCLGIAVNKNSEEGELHQIVLSISGDLESSKVFTGFGPIKDLCFTFCNRSVQ